MRDTNVYNSNPMVHHYMTHHSQQQPQYLHHHHHQQQQQHQQPMPAPASSYPPTATLPPAASSINMELEDKELWTRFYNLTNEMILTKAGRRTFPLVKIRLSGVEESALYTIQIEFRIADEFKYRFVNGEWRASPRNDSLKSAPPPILYEHSDSPNFGHHWTKDSIAFAKLKLTNNENTRATDSVFLRSLNKYDPVIHVYRHDKKNVDDRKLVFSRLFHETQFIAVTAYQNEQVTFVSTSILINLQNKFFHFAERNFLLKYFFVFR